MHLNYDHHPSLRAHKSLEVPKVPALRERRPLGLEGPETLVALTQSSTHLLLVLHHLMNLLVSSLLRPPKALL